MKIPPNDSGNKKITPAESDAVVLKRRAEQKAETAKEINAAATQLLGGTSEGADGTDKVDLSLGKYISQELDPEKLEAESKDRVAKLKALIEAGQYKPDTTKVAEKVSAALTEEISAEQFLANNSGDVSES